MLQTRTLNKSLSLAARIRLFHSVVTPTVLYGCESWILHQHEVNQIRKTQRKMLRMILGSGRRKQPVKQTQQENEIAAVSPIDVAPHPEQINDTDADSTSTGTSNGTKISSTTDLEPFVDWIRRTTHQIEDKINKMGL